MLSIFSLKVFIFRYSSFRQRCNANISSNQMNNDEGNMIDWKKKNKLVYKINHF